MKHLRTPLNQERLEQGVATLCAIEPRFNSVIAAHGLPSLRPLQEGLSGLLLTVTEQFLSLKAAAVIWRRLEARLQPLTPQRVLDCAHSELLGLGLSGAKARSFHGIASAILDGGFHPESLAELDDDEARLQLLALPGVGPWTADIYLLGALQRPDIWPWGDLALQQAAQSLFSIPVRPGKPGMILLAEAFRPWRAVAARLLWSHYRGLKGMKQAQ